MPNQNTLPHIVLKQSDLTHLSVVQMLSLRQDDTALYTVAYLTSAWVQPMDEVVLPRLHTIVDKVNALSHNHHLLEVLKVCRTDEGGSCDTKVQRLEPSAFRSLCKRYQVTYLPACVLVDAQGRMLTPQLLRDLKGELHQLHEDGAESADLNSLWKVLEKLLTNHDDPAAAWDALQPLSCTAARSGLTESFQFDDLDLVKMRTEALKRFEKGELLSAASGFVSVLMRCPTCTKASFNLAVILQTIGETYFAVSSMLRVVALDDSDSVAHTVLRSIYYPEEPDLVIAGYHLILSKNRNSHLRAAHSLATLEGATTTRTAAPAYVAEVFDELADTFEEKLVAHLEYRVPWQLVDALQRLSPPTFVSKGSANEPMWVVADIGCGTGLCGRLLRPHVKHITGMDISPLMIEKTRAEGNYDELHIADIVPFLKSCANEALDLIISADVWIYVGALEQVFELSARKLHASTGWMAFSIELLNLGTTANVENSTAGFRLAPSGRFQHSHEYITSLAIHYGFTIALQEDISVRKESGEPILGRIYLLQRAVTKND